MPTLADTAYPRLRASPGDAELAEAYTPSGAELAFAARRTRQPGPRLALLVMLKPFQRLGYFVQPDEVPPAIAAHVAAAAGLSHVLGELGAYGATSSYRSRLMALVRDHVGVAPYGQPARKAATRAAIEASRGRDDLADIVNAAIEELARCRFELPAFGTLLRIARTARALVNRGYHRRAAAAMPAETRSRLQALLAVPEGQPRSAWDAVKAAPERPSPQRMRVFLQHLAWLREQTADEALAGIPDQKLRQFAAEARSLNAADLQRTTEAKRLTLVAALLRGRAAAALDEAAEMFVRLTARMHNRAEEALDEHLRRHAGETDVLIALLRETVVAAKGAGDPAARLAALDALLLPDADGVIERCEAHAALAGGNPLPLLGRFYKGQRAAFIRFLEHAKPVSTSQDRSVEGAIAFLLDHRTHRHPRLAVVREAGRGGKCVAHSLVNLSFVPERWWPLVTGQKGHDPAPREVDRRYFELCLFTQVVNELKSGDLCLPGSGDYGDYRDQLVSWDEYHRDVAAYAEQAGVSADSAAFVADLKARLAAVADEVDRVFPANEPVEIVGGRPVISRLRAKASPDGADRLERLLKERLAPVGILDALAETEHWLGWTRSFGPVSGFEGKLERARERYLSAAFCYGCGLGPSQAARSLKGLDRRHVAFVNQRHVTEETLDEAITGVIDAYAAIGLHRNWGSGETASADGMKWDVHPQSLMTEYHIRYGGYGGIGYYLVSDTYIALFSRFIACGAYEGHSILDFVAENRPAIQPSTVHADTHGQSAPIFGLAHLLGIELMPRIRNWQDLHLFRPSAGATYVHIDALFSGPIDWPLIAEHLPDMLRVTLSIKAGRLLPSAILRRLGTYSRKNRLYFAFRELGRAVRTIFLLRYIGSLDLRRTIGAATNKSELFNKYAQWVNFGGGGLVTAAARDEQRKMIKYNHLVANLLIFHTAVDMMRALEQMATDGLADAISPEALATLSPYQTEHINRFGNYVLDLSSPPASLPFTLPVRQPRRRQTAAAGNV
jgi:TnpA family transposase